MSRFSEADHAAFARIVDLILPAAHGMPSGNELSVAHEGLDRALSLRPDLASDVLRGIRVFAHGGDSGFGRLQADDDAWRAVRLCAYGAYYNAPPVQALLDYAGQPSRPFDPDEVPDYLRDGSLQQVIDRGPIWTRVSH